MTAPQQTVTAPQQPIGSGFGPHSTTGDVLQGVDLTGRTALVTGGASGLGRETVRALASAGASVVVAVRDPAPAAARAPGPGVTALELDLTDPDSIRRLADDVLAAGRRIDVLVANAGVMACPETRVGPGWELQFAVNHLGHFALVNRLWPALGPAARVVVVSSAGHHGSGVRWSDPHFRTGYDKWLAYGQSKTANVLFAVHLDRLARDRGVRAFALHPGKILTPLQRHLPRAEMVAAGWVDAAGALADPEFKTVEQGAATQVWAATSPQLTALGGLYCEDCEIAPPARSDRPFVGVADHATDPGEAARLWSLSAELTGLDALG